jgi:dTDP-glucose 4,6-dehydratase
MRKHQNILVTGGCGFIGSAFIRYTLFNRFLEDEGLIVNIDRLSTGSNLANLESIHHFSNYHFYQSDIKDRMQIRAICIKHKIDTIVHFAAESHVDRSIYQPDECIQTNINGTFELLEVVRSLPEIHFHHISTDEVFGSLDANRFFNENSSYQPNSPYSASKACSDHLVRAWSHTYNLSTTLSHCSNNYGPYQHPEKLIPHMIYACLTDKPLPIYGRGANIRDWIHVEDHVRGIWCILEKAKRNEGYNIGARSEKTNLVLVQNLCREVAEQLQMPINTYVDRIQFVQDRLGHDLRYAIDSTKIEMELLFRPLYNFEEGLKTTISWYLNHQEWLLAHQAIGIQTKSTP